MYTSKPICIILARGGSTRIPRKNIRNFCGKPMIAWPIQTAICSKLFSSVIVSTDNNEIANIAQKNGADIPFMRPAIIADEFSTTMDVIHHTLQYLSTTNKTLPAHLCCMYGTSAFITQELLNEGYDTLTKTNAECVFAVSQYAHPLERAMQFDESGFLQYRYPDKITTRTQDITPSYYDIGLFYWLDTESLIQKAKSSFMPLQKKALVVPHFAALDIDSEDDWINAENLARIQNYKCFVNNK